MGSTTQTEKPDNRFSYPLKTASKCAISGIFKIESTQYPTESDDALILPHDTKESEAVLETQKKMKYAVPTKEGKIEMLRVIQKKWRKNETDEITKTEFETFLKKSVQDHLEGKEIECGRLEGDELLEKIVDTVEDDSWMRFVRLHLSMKDAHIKEFKRNYCNNGEMYSIIRVYA